MTSEIEQLLARERARAWTRHDTDKVKAELQRFGLLGWEKIGKRWPHKMAGDFYRSHAATDIDSHTEATRAIYKHAVKWGVSEEFVFCLCALGFLAQDTITQGFAMAVALSMSQVVAEPFILTYKMELHTPFWEPPKEDE